MSIGTIAIMGIHFILIGTTNYIQEKTLNIEGKIIYPWYVAYLLVLFFKALIYPIKIFFFNHIYARQKSLVKIVSYLFFMFYLLDFFRYVVVKRGITFLIQVHLILYVYLF